MWMVVNLIGSTLRRCFCKTEEKGFAFEALCLPPRPLPFDAANSGDGGRLHREAWKWLLV